MVSALRPFFDAAYIASGGLGRTAPMLEMLTIDPPPAAAIRSPATAISRNGPLRLTSMVLSNSASDTDARSRRSGAMPALLTRMSRRPSSAMIRSTAGSMRPTARRAAPAGAQCPDPVADDRLSRLLAGRRPCGWRRRPWRRPRRGRAAMAKPRPAGGAGDQGDLAGQVAGHGAPVCSSCSARAGRWCAGAPRWGRRRSAVHG